MMIQVRGRECDMTCRKVGGGEYIPLNHLDGQSGKAAVDASDVNGIIQRSTLNT